MKKHVIDHIKPGKKPVKDGPEDRLIHAEGDGDGQGSTECNARLDPLSLIKKFNHFPFQKSSSSTPSPSATLFT